jgi:hypothetical protein
MVIIFYLISFCFRPVYFTFNPYLIIDIHHLKLSDYYYKIDASPFYLWSSRKFDIQFTLITYL